MGIVLSKINASFEVIVFDYPMCAPQCAKVIRFRGRHVPRISPRRGPPALEGALRSLGGPLGD